MTIASRLVVVMLAAGLLAGCSSFKKLTGQTDNTVLPGEREDILPPDQQVNPRPNKTVADSGAAPLEPAACDPAVDISCEAPVDQEASSDGAQ
jgi:hypothetical protein